MRVLVTGGCGFIGSHLVQRLLRKDHEVAILDTLVTGHPDNLGDDFRRVAYIQGSVSNWDAVRRALRGVHLVYHLAARMDWSDKPRHPIAMEKTNVGGTCTILTLARTMGVQRVIFASSAAVYGNVFPGSEDGPRMPCNFYGTTKLAAEQICTGFTPLGVDVAILRLFNVYGPRGYGVINLWQDNETTPSIYGDGTKTRDYVHVNDVVEAFVRAALWEPGIYNVGTGTEVTDLGLWQLLCGDEEPVFKPDRFSDIYRSFADTSKVDPLWKAERSLIEA